MPKLIEHNLRNFSQKLGADFTLVQGAGGNTSLKIDDKILVKASGTRLEDALNADIFTTVERTADPFAKEFLALEGPRPSIETGLHLLTPHRVTAHVHAVGVIALSCLTNAADILTPLLSGLEWCYIPYVKPGADLTKAIDKALNKSAVHTPNVFILGNHGLVVGADDFDDANALIMNVCQKIADHTRITTPPTPSQIEKANRYAPPGMIAARHPAAHIPAFDKTARDYACGGTLYPDHVVFLGRGAACLSTQETPNLTQTALHFIPDIGAFLPQDANRAAHEMAGALGLVSGHIPKDAKLRYLTPQEEDSLLNWDAEKHRQTLSNES